MPPYIPSSTSQSHPRLKLKHVQTNPKFQSPNQCASSCHGYDTNVNSQSRERGKNGENEPKYRKTRIDQVIALLNPATILKSIFRMKILTFNQIMQKFTKVIPLMWKRKRGGQLF
nr:BPK_HP1_G0058350.mRNA.1.CDS.1 [Saccharomyces cerevisiae]